jgi:hypothetical protein
MIYTAQLRAVRDLCGEGRVLVCGFAALGTFAAGFAEFNGGLRF